MAVNTEQNLLHNTINIGCSIFLGLGAWAVQLFPQKYTRLTTTTTTMTQADTTDFQLGHCHKYHDRFHIMRPIQFDDYYVFDTYANNRDLHRK